ncbi:hypothetical protein IG631_05388 [Alternaria alternata]|nr:hypothetical protein IG631_05388 [Alternaria alternata]
MKQSIIVSILSMAMAVSAVPTSIAPTNNGNVNQCSGGNNKQVCCNNGLLGLLTCSVQVLGGACDGSVTCCNTQAAEATETEGDGGGGKGGDCRIRYLYG